MGHFVAFHDRDFLIWMIIIVPIVFENTTPFALRHILSKASQSKAMALQCHDDDGIGFAQLLCRIWSSAKQHPKGRRGGVLNAPLARRIWRRGRWHSIENSSNVDF
jgi:hypothetical protein